jgi:hypothetical protein
MTPYPFNRAVVIATQKWRWLWSYYPNALLHPWDDEA